MHQDLHVQFINYNNFNKMSLESTISYSLMNFMI